MSHQWKNNQMSRAIWPNCSFPHKPWWCLWIEPWDHCGFLGGEVTVPGGLHCRQGSPPQPMAPSPSPTISISSKLPVRAPQSNSTSSGLQQFTSLCGGWKGEWDVVRGVSIILRASPHGQVRWPTSEHHTTLSPWCEVANIQIMLPDCWVQSPDLGREWHTFLKTHVLSDGPVD